MPDTPPGPSARTLVIDKLVMNSTPQSGTWLFCFGASAGNSSAAYNQRDKEFEGDGVQISMGLELPEVVPGTAVAFTVRLDDDQSDVCAESAEDRTSGKFTPSSSGSESFSDGEFRYVLHWQFK